MTLKLLALAGLLLPGIACAQSVQGLYVSGNAGINFAGSPSATTSTQATKIHTNPGPVGLAALGWGFGNGLRTELEGSYRSNNIGGISTLRGTGSFTPLTGVKGDVATYAVMANLAYDIPLHPFGLPVQPYVGAGLGYGWLDLNSAQGNGATTFLFANNNHFGPGPDVVRFGTAGAFAYQAMIGASLPLPALPGVSLTLEYRFFGMARADIPVTRTTTTGDRVNGVVPSSRTQNGFSLFDNAVLFGARYSFGAP